MITKNDTRTIISGTVEYTNESKRITFAYQRHQEESKTLYISNGRVFVDDAEVATFGQDVNGNKTIYTKQDISDISSLVSTAISEFEASFN